MIEIKHLKKIYESVTPLEDVNAVIENGDIVAVIGPSGTGKSTFLRMINCLEDASSGEIIIDGENILSPKCNKALLRRKVGMVFQNFNLFAHLNVAENIMYGPMNILGLTPQAAYEKAQLLLKQVGLSDRTLSYPNELSGGQQQRVAIARALAMDPEVILFDEPTSALDPTMVGEVKSVIRTLAKSGMTMMIVTHDMDFAKEIATRIFFMDEGVIYEEGSPLEVFDHPRKEKTRQFMQRLKVLRKEVSAGFDFPSLVSELEDYGKRIILSAKQNYRMQVITEEMLMQVILPVLGIDLKAELLIEHSDENGETRLSFKYNGRNENLLETANGFSKTIIANSALDITYKQTEEDIYTNEISLKLAV